MNPQDDLPDVPPAPRRPALKSLMCAKDLTYELAMGTLELCTKGQPIHTEPLKRVRLALARTYVQKYSTIPSYLGSGRSNDGLFLYRGKKAKEYSPSVQNATRAWKWLKDNGYDLEAVAAELGYDTVALLLEEIKALPEHKD